MQAGVTKQVYEKLVKEQLKQKRLQKAERQKAEMGAAQSGDPRFRANICVPKYVMNERLRNWEEVDIPPKEVFEPLGYDRKPEPDKEGYKGEKHYRKFFTDELEQCEELMSKPSEFDQFMLKKGQSRGAGGGGLLGGLFGGDGK